MIKSDFLIIGGGIFGISIARQLKQQYPNVKVIVLEKEPQIAAHASGRNSGVIHAGFYYTADSLKAKFTKRGNQLLTEYCESRKLAINKCGKLVVAKHNGDLPFLEELLKRGQANGVELQRVTAKEAKSIEPRVLTYEKALFSPTTSSVNPLEVMECMAQEALREGVEIHFDTRYLKKSSSGIMTSAGLYQTGYCVNAAGLYADKVAMDFGFSERYRILPFKGLYLYSDEPVGALRTNVYPVPDLQNPFLGVHFTMMVDGHMKIGPTAIPALWREQYGTFENFRLSELMEIAVRELQLMIQSNFQFRRLAIQEIQKYSRSHMIAQAASLVEGIRPEHFQRWGRPGIRAQLMNVKKGTLEMDFVVEGDRHSFHVLNAVSPGFTCALPFAQYICERIGSLLH